MSLEQNYKKVCFNIGLILIVFHISRICGGVVITVFEQRNDTVNYPAMYLLSVLLRVLFVYAIPTAFALYTLKPDMSKLYKKPKHMTKALANFPAVYGMGSAVNLLTVTAIYFVSKLLRSGGVSFEKAAGAVDVNMQNIANIIISFLLMVVIAPICEEIFVRGIIMRALSPYGAGFSIITTGIIFGIIHGNFQQCFYAAAMGICLGYITYVSGSILASTILHTGVNCISSTVMIFLQNDAVRDVIETQKYEKSGSNEFVVMIFALILSAMLILMVVGVVVGVKKLIKIKPKFPETEMRPRRRAALFMGSLPVLLSLLFIADAFSGSFIAHGILRLLT